MRAVDPDTQVGDGCSLPFSSRGWKRHEGRDLVRDSPYPAQFVYLGESNASNSVRANLYGKYKAGDGLHRHEIFTISSIGN